MLMRKVEGRSENRANPYKEFIQLNSKKKKKRLQKELRTCIDIFQKKTNGQQIHENMLNITNHQEKGKSKPQWDITSHLLEWLLSKRQKIKSVDEGVEKREPLYTIGRNVHWCGHYGKQVWRFLKKLKIELLFDPAIPFLGICPKEMKSVSWRDICTPMFIAGLFTIAKL